jgi:enamine deaminase RidA (YjgF/YER057c/UK114 family)
MKIIPIHHEPMKSECNSTFSANLPSRSVILVADLVHTDLMIEIDDIAAVPKS